MTFNLDWADDEKTIILVTYHPGWTWQEAILETTAPEIELLNTVEHPVYIVHHILGRLPTPSIGWTYTAETEGSFHHPNYAGAVVITPHKMNHMLFNVFVRRLPGVSHKIHLVQTPEQAYSLIASLKEKAAQTNN